MVTKRHFKFAAILLCLFAVIAGGYSFLGLSIEGMDPSRYTYERHCYFAPYGCYPERHDLWLSKALDKATRKGP